MFTVHIGSAAKDRKDELGFKVKEGVALNHWDDHVLLVISEGSSKVYMKLTEEKAEELMEELMEALRHGMGLFPKKDERLAEPQQKTVLFSIAIDGTDRKAVVGKPVLIEGNVCGIVKEYNKDTHTAVFEMDPIKMKVAGYSMEDFGKNVDDKTAFSLSVEWPAEIEMPKIVL